MISRREFLAVGGAALSAWPRVARAKPFLVPVKVSRELVTRTIVGLRPFRPAGFVVRAEKLVGTDQTVVHHYGHGGCGITLSWGTAERAADLVMATGKKEIAVLGAGVIGLTTARVLQARGLSPTIYTKEESPRTTSDVAGGRWYPFDVFDSAAVAPGFADELWSTARIAYKKFTSLDAARYGISRLRTYNTRNSPVPKTSLLHDLSPIRDLMPGLRDLAPGTHPFPYPIVRTFETLMIEPQIYLPAIIEDVKKAGAKIMVRDFATTSEIAALSEKVIVNCTGLGARTLFGDMTLVPIKGQLTFLQPQPEVDYVILPRDGYMFPRKDGIILGGTFVRGDFTTTVDTVAEARIFEEHRNFFAALKR